MINNGVTITTCCPDCNETISFYRRPQIGQLHACPHCTELFSVLVSAPLLLDFALERPLLFTPHLENRTTYATIPA